MVDKVPINIPLMKVQSNNFIFNEDDFNTPSYALRRFICAYNVVYHY